MSRLVSIPCLAVFALVVSSVAGQQINFLSGLKKNLLQNGLNRPQFNPLDPLNLGSFFNFGPKQTPADMIQGFVQNLPGAMGVKQSPKSLFEDDKKMGKQLEEVGVLIQRLIEFEESGGFKGCKLCPKVVSQIIAADGPLFKEFFGRFPKFDEMADVTGVTLRLFPLLMRLQSQLIEYKR